MGQSKGDSMLGYEYERLFDSTLKKVLPYLVLSPKEFRDSLADRMAGLFHFLSEQHSEIQFNDLNKNINEMIDSEKREGWDSTIEIKIHNFNERQMSFDERLRNHNERITKLENAIKKKSKELSPIIEKESELSPIIEKAKKIPAISENEIQQLELIKNYLKTNERITNIKAKEILGVNTSQASKLLKKLIKENFVKQMGTKRGTYYERM